jgi:hypothetical protein
MGCLTGLEPVVTGATILRVTSFASDTIYGTMAACYLRCVFTSVLFWDTAFAEHGRVYYNPCCLLRHTTVANKACDPLIALDHFVRIVAG